MGDAELVEALRRRQVLVEGERVLSRRFEALCGRARTCSSTVPGGSRDR
jgi:hypothetical protein